MDFRTIAEITIAILIAAAVLFAVRRFPRGQEQPQEQ